MKKLFCMLCCAMLALSAVNCALAAEAGELATATSLKAYLPTVGWDDYTATDADGDGFDDEIMIPTMPMATPIQIRSTSIASALTARRGWSAACAACLRMPIP